MGESDRFLNDEYSQIFHRNFDMVLLIKITKITLQIPCLPPSAHINQHLFVFFFFIIKDYARNVLQNLRVDTMH